MNSVLRNRLVVLEEADRLVETALRHNICPKCGGELENYEEETKGRHVSHYFWGCRCIDTECGFRTEEGSNCDPV